MGDITPLCELAYKYRTDKCPQIKHVYTPVYHQMFGDRREQIKSVFEMGIGYNKKDLIGGASLRMWRDYFPKATIYGMDKLKSTLFEEERIKTFLCSQNNREGVKKVLGKIGQIDIFIDDAIHEWRFQSKLALLVMPLLSKESVYIIEDANYFDLDRLLGRLKDYDVRVPHLPFREYGKIKLSGIPKVPASRLVTIKHK